ncbi:unnamed protein product [Dovyalis caffra]|uniref:Uncharacterized protein n=1 Tax=Dovyalis caffra TaxID=77055 RepID=A0AAV1R161_9ROSI|nr:unnamed protein product [Dovyalis caffra]
MGLANGGNEVIMDDGDGGGGGGLNGKSFGGLFHVRFVLKWLLILWAKLQRGCQFHLSMLRKRKETMKAQRMNSNPSPVLTTTQQMRGKKEKDRGVLATWGVL